MRLRCAWCARFIKGSTPLTCWRVRVPEPNRQRADSEWNFWARYLCPACAPSIGTLWKRSASEDQVVDYRPEGLPPSDPRWDEPMQDSPLLVTAPTLMFGADPHERVRL